MLGFIVYFNKNLFLKNKIFITIFIFYLSFYCDQKHLIFPLIISVLNFNFSNIFSKKNLNLIFFNFICLIPFFYLIYLWESFFPKSVNSIYASSAYNLKFNFWQYKSYNFNFLLLSLDYTNLLQRNFKKN